MVVIVVLVHLHCCFIVGFRLAKGIWVLQATGMPSVLVETGFITNEDEEKYINSDQGQDEIVSAIIAALKRYKSVLEQSKNGTSPANNGNNQK